MRFPIIPTALVACLTLGLAPTLSLADTADAAGGAAAADSSNEGNDAAADAVPTGGLQVFGVLGIVLGPVLFAVAGAILDVLSDETVASGDAAAQAVDARS